MEATIALAAATVAAAHLGIVAFLLTGGFLALRRPALVPWHVAVVAAVLAVNLLGADCPLTVLENALREESGMGAYDGGFLEHYIVRPFTGGAMTADMQLVMQGSASGSVAVPYALRLRRVRTAR